ncbi:hypothetical protein AB0J28_47070, partial [Streptosporangium canum]|uniref:hypothetical protein n=1 Tax=Streptosporangium canum TaxID=324952 RepID=UPI00343B02E8
TAAPGTAPLARSYGGTGIAADDGRTGAFSRVRTGGRPFGPGIEARSTSTRRDRANFSEPVPGSLSRDTQVSSDPLVVVQNDDLHSDIVRL